MKKGTKVAIISGSAVLAGLVAWMIIRKK